MLKYYVLHTTKATLSLMQKYISVVTEQVIDSTCPPTDCLQVGLSTRCRITLPSNSITTL